MLNYFRKSTAVILLIIVSLVQMGLPRDIAAMTLEQLQEMGINNRDLIEKYRLTIQQQKEVTRTRESAFWPSLDLAYNANMLDEDSTFENNENSELIGSVSYNVFNGFKDRNTLRAAEVLVTAREFDLDSITQEIKYRIAVRFLEIYRAKNRLDVAEKEVDLLRKQHQDAENRHKVGLMRKSDLLSLKVQLDDSIQKMASAAADLEKSINRLKFESGVDFDETALDFSTFARLPDIKGYSFYQNVLFENHSSIKQLQATREAAGFSAKAATSDYYPSVNLTASYRKYGDDFTFGTQEDGEDEVRLAMGVSLNLFDGFRKQANISVARIETKRIEKDLRELESQLSTDLKNVIMDLSVAQKNLVVAESSMAQAEENQRVTDAAFKEGVESATDVLVAVLALSRAQFNAIDARSGVFLRYYQLLRLVENL